jgi:hypothetical protein
MTSTLDVDPTLESAGVLFLPWVGEQYKRGFEGVRLLILGESHYDTDKRDRSVPNRDVTRAGIRWYMKSGTPHKFSTNTQHVVSRRSLAVAERETFWNSIAFYNYVQSFAGVAARDPVTPEMWERSRAPFCAVLKALDPEAVVVLGYKTWEHLLDYPKGPALPDRKGVGECPGRWLPARSGQALAFHTMHPSALFSASQWYERVAAGIRLAGEQNSNYQAK